MSIESVPSVELCVKHRPFKFVVARIADGSGATKIIIRAGNDKHSVIYANVRDQLYEHQKDLKITEKMGGGNIWVSFMRKEIRIYEASQDFGREPDRDLTIQMIKVAYPEFSVTTE